MSGCGRLGLGLLVADGIIDVRLIVKWSRGLARQGSRHFRMAEAMPSSVLRDRERCNLKIAQIRALLLLGTLLLACASEQDGCVKLHFLILQGFIVANCRLHLLNFNVHLCVCQFLAMI